MGIGATGGGGQWEGQQGEGDSGNRGNRGRGTVGIGETGGGGHIAIPINSANQLTPPDLLTELGSSCDYHTKLNRIEQLPVSGSQLSESHCRGEA